MQTERDELEKQLEEKDKQITDLDTVAEENESLQAQLEDERKAKNKLEAKSKAEDRKKASQRSKTNNYLYTEQMITSDIGNVRSGPGFKYDVIQELLYGDPVYLSDAAVCEDGITWFYIGNGWISINVINWSGL